jgi:hypothetical protein
MQMTMEAELQREATRRQYEERKGVIQSALNSSLENDKAIEAVLLTKVSQVPGDAAVGVFPKVRRLHAILFTRARQLLFSFLKVRLC